MAERIKGFFSKIAQFFKNLPSNITKGCKAFGQGMKNFPSNVKKEFTDDYGKFTLRKIKGWFYLAPALVLLAVFTFYPLVNTVFLSFWEDYKISSQVAGDMPLKIGFKNYIKVFENAQLGEGLRNTAVLAVITVPISTMIALLIAVGLNSIKPLRKLLQTIFLLPYVTNSIAIGMVFAMIFNVVKAGGNINDPGLFNRLLGVFGIDLVDWLAVGDAFWPKIFVMSVYIIWNALPFKIMILLGALQSVNKQYYDAAKVDGSSRLTIFTKITVPLISPMLFYVIVTGFIGAF